MSDTRRRAARRSCALLACIALTACDSQPAGTGSIVVLSYGGEFEQAQRAAFFDPFQASTGIEVVSASYGGEYGRIQSGLAGGVSPWDVIDVESSTLLRAVADSLLLPIDYSRVDTAGLPIQVRHPFGVGTDFYSVSLGWNSDTYPDSVPTPATWTDFWDVVGFPGRRSLKRDPRFTLEIALLADGVPLDSVYAGGGLDLDRAFASLDRIRDHVAVWWTSGQEPIDLLASGEVDLVAAFGARLHNAMIAGQPVRMTWKNGILDTEYWVVPRGTAAPERAMDFIAFATRPQQQAVLPQHLPLGPTQPLAFALLPDSLLPVINSSPDNLPTQVVFAAEYWAQNEDRIRQRFEDWLAIGG